MVDWFYGPTSALGLTCVWLVSRDFLSLKVGLGSNSNFFINFQIINWRAQPKSTKKSMQVLNLNGVCTTNTNKDGNVFYSGFSSVILWSSVRRDWCKHCSGHSVATQACTVDDKNCVVLWRTALIHAMNIMLHIMVVQSCCTLHQINPECNPYVCTVT